MPSSNAKLEDGENGKPALQTRLNRYFRTERAAWTALLLLPLLTYCVVAVLTYSIKATPLNTGDPLYDKYIAWVADDLLEKGGSAFTDNFLDNVSAAFYGRYEQRWEAASGGVDFDPFAGWETEFGDDPRYWLLRYHYAVYANKFVTGQPNPELECLHRARELGVADGAVLLLLLRTSDNLIWRQSTLHAPGGYADSNKTARFQKDKRGQVDELMGAEHDQLLAELLEVAGDNSLPHYYAALYDSQRGDYEAAMDHLADGNRTPNNSSLVGFPFEDLRLDIQSGKPAPDKLTSGAIVMDAKLVPLRNYRNFKQMVKLLLGEATRNSDRSAFNEIHKFSCRFGAATGDDIVTFGVGSSMVGFVEYDFFSNFGISLTVEQINSLAELGNIRGSAKSQIKMRGGNIHQASPHEMSLFPKWVWLTESTLSGGMSGECEYLGAYHDVFENEQTLVANTLNQIFQQMESFNYITLEFE